MMVYSKFKQNIILIYLVVLMCSCNQDNQLFVEKRLKEEINVIEALLPDILKNHYSFSDKKTVIYIDSSLVCHSIFETEEEAEFSTPKNNYQNKLRLILNLMEDRKKRIYINLKELLSIPNIELIPSSSWKGKFKQTLGVIGISRVYFNSDMDASIFYYTWNCPGDCGGSFIVFAKKIKGIWHIDDSVIISNY